MARAHEAPRMQIGTSMLLLPLLSLAHVASLLDVSSEGRLRLGVAPGWQPDEFDISGIDHKNRL